MTTIVRERGRGRPRAFDEAEFLDGAIALFSASGFSGVGINALTEATGLTVGSVYKAYGDKEGVFIQALERYIALREAHILTLFENADCGQAKIEILLRLYVDLSIGREGKLGCMVVAGIADLDQVGRAAEPLGKQLSARRTLLTQLVLEGQRDGSVTTGDAPSVVAEVLLALLQGMRVIGKGEQLTGEADAFIACALRILD